MHDAVGANIFILEEVVLHIFRELFEGRLRICKIGVSPMSFGRERMCTKQTKASSSWIEARVDMKDTVTLQRYIQVKTGPNI